MKRGRKPPTEEHVEDVISALCAGLREGIPASVVHRKNPHFPKRETVYMWRRNNPELEARIVTAREDGWDEIAYRCRLVASGDTENGSSGDVRRDKLIVDTDLLLLEKWDPLRYGKRVEIGGTVKHEATDLSTMSTQLVTQVTMNPTLRPVLEAWAENLLTQLRKPQ